MSNAAIKVQRSRPISSTARGVGVVKRADISRQQEDIDLFALGDSVNLVIPTPYSLQAIAGIYEKSNILSQCVEAYAVNISRFGYRAVPIRDGVTMDAGEKELLESFIEKPNTEETLSSVHSKRVRDYEKYGFCFMEIIRDRSGKVSLWKHCKSFYTRIMVKGETLVPVTVIIERGGKRSKIVEIRRFRRYVQTVAGKFIYFKEFGDVRDMDYRDGRYATADRPVDKEYLATELLHYKQQSEDLYGIPRWIAQVPNILGSRESEEVNLRYFEDNTVPPLLLSVAGGRLTKTSFNQLRNLLDNDGVGKDRQNRILLLEAIPETGGGLDDKGNTVQLKVDKLADARQSDALFGDYDKSNIDKIRSSFRLPPVVVGMSQDVNFSTAQTSVYLAEMQVFAPERMSHDDFLNTNLINHPQGLNLKTVKLESRSPRATNPDQIVKTLTALNVMGGLTPRTAIDTINETMQLSLPTLPTPGESDYEEWMDMPISLSQRAAIGDKTQQTGEGANTHSGQQSKLPDNKKVEATGETGVASQAVEHGQE